LALTAPTPRAFGVAFGGGTAASMRAPLTWSGVQLGLTERMCAAAPATTGAANEVPDIHADGDHERVVGRRVLDAAGGGGAAVVARRGHDDDAAEPELLDRLAERSYRKLESTDPVSEKFATRMS
jgi:hypothetical protein